MIIIDYQDRRPIYEQVVEKIKILVLKNVLKPNEQLPSVRKLAMDLSINPNTIQRAYNQLETEGLIYSVKGKGSYISPNLELLDLQMQQYYEELKKVVQKGKEKGIKEDDILEKVSTWYKEV
ncbi:MAG: GntR family transcriptional regulator [Eubacteriales bacterium]